MSNVQIVILIVVTTIVVSVMELYVFPTLKKKKIDAQDILQKADKGLNVAGTVINVADEILPNNPAIAILKLAQNAAKNGVDHAEQLCISSQLDENQRNAKARETAWDVLKYAGVKETPDLDKIVDSFLEADTLALGHKTPTDTEKAAQLQQAQQNVTTLQQENTQLKQKLQTIQSAAK